MHDISNASLWVSVRITRGKFYDAFEMTGSMCMDSESLSYGRVLESIFFESSTNDSDVQLALDVICANQVFFSAVF